MANAQPAQPALQADMNTRLHVLNQPKLPLGDEQPEHLMLHIVKLRKWGQEIGCEDYITGPLPNAPDASKQQLGRRFVITSFESDGLRGLIAAIGANDSGPAKCNWRKIGISIYKSS